MWIKITVTLEHIESSIRKFQLKENQGRSASICPTALAIAEVVQPEWTVRVSFGIIDLISHQQGVFITSTPDVVRDFEVMFDDLVLDGQQHDDVKPYEFDWELPDEFTKLFLPDKMSVS